MDETNDVSKTSIARPYVRVECFPALGLPRASALCFAECSTPSGKPLPIANPLCKASATLRADDMPAVPNALAAMDCKAIEKVDIPTAHAQPTIVDVENAVLKEDGRDTGPSTLVAGVTSCNFTVQGAAGSPPASFYKPAGNGPFLVVTHFYASGWAIGDRGVYDGGAWDLAKAAIATAVSVDYRRASEARLLAAWNDAFASYKWVESHAGYFGGDLKKRLSLRKCGRRPHSCDRNRCSGRSRGNVCSGPCGLSGSQTGNMNAESYIENALDMPLDQAMIALFLDTLLSAPTDMQDPPLDPVCANLSGLPPVAIINAQLDPLRDDGAMHSEFDRGR